MDHLHCQTVSPVVLELNGITIIIFQNQYLIQHTNSRVIPKLLACYIRITSTPTIATNRSPNSTETNFHSSFLHYVSVNQTNSSFRTQHRWCCCIKMFFNFCTQVFSLFLRVHRIASEQLGRDKVVNVEQTEYPLMVHSLR